MASKFVYFVQFTNSRIVILEATNHMLEKVAVKHLAAVERSQISLTGWHAHNISQRSLPFLCIYLPSKVTNMATWPPNSKLWTPGSSLPWLLQLSNISAQPGMNSLQFLQSKHHSGIWLPSAQSKAGRYLF